MRRLVALLSFLAFGNLSLAQASGVCPIAEGHAQVAVADAHHGGHAGHATAASGNAASIDESPVNDSNHPSCLMMGPCGLNVDVDRVISTTARVPHGEGVTIASDLLPPSETRSPESPPPKA